MDLTEMTQNGNDKDTLYMLGGVALVVFGAGLILSNPFIRRYLSQLGVGGLAQAAIPDVERYLKLRAMEPQPGWNELDLDALQVGVAGAPGVARTEIVAW
jgi:hypothetical protein